MELGFARFLEMFEERFGRLSTTVLMGALGMAALFWAVQTIIEALVYVYKHIAATHLIAAFENESTAAHLIIFAVQIVITGLVSWYIWRWFLQRRIQDFRGRVSAEIAAVQAKFDDLKGKQEQIMQLMPMHKETVEKATAAMLVIKDAVEKHVAEIKSAEQTGKKD
jgi:hypothetical protein